jgi:hypothetical protein
MPPPRLPCPAAAPQRVRIPDEARLPYSPLAVILESVFTGDLRNDVQRRFVPKDAAIRCPVQKPKPRQASIFKSMLYVLFG